MTVFEKNIAVIRSAYPDIAERLENSPCSTAYSGVRNAKTGEAIPVFNSGQALHSLYNPVKEAERLFTGSCGFALFCGIGAGVHIKIFLEKMPQAHCALTEADYPALKSLLSLIDYRDILTDRRVQLLPPFTDEAFSAALARSYLPALHGSFECRILRTWNDYFTEQTTRLPRLIEETLERIKADFSVQAHFGKVWMRNIFHNLYLAGAIQPQRPCPDTRTTALILGAGPSLEHGIQALMKNRRCYSVFCTDTALPALTARRITPEFFIAIDPQHISYLHTIGALPRETIGIFDLSTQSAIVRRFYENGNKFFFTAGGHPLAQTAALFSPFPYLHTASGTVGVAAYHAAQSLGFKEPECYGMDFAYTNGAAYARGTYLSALYANAADRLSPQEYAFVRLMFRTEIHTERNERGYTYRTDLLDSYRCAFESEKNTAVRWRAEDFKRFPYRSFCNSLIRRASAGEHAVMMGMLPLFAWCSRHETENFPTIELAVQAISEYTGLR